jgi:hypothetical protein
MNKLVACSADAKRCAKQIITGAFNEIQCGNFRIPTQKEMEKSLENFIDYNFDEYQVRSKIIAKHPGWDKERVKSEVYKTKMKFDKEYRNNLKHAVSEAITEIENLISSLNDTIKTWKIKNLE